jgi:hypothetical protein
MKPKALRLTPAQTAAPNRTPYSGSSPALETHQSSES